MLPFVIALLLLSFPGCGGGSSECAFDPDDFTNGTSSETQGSQWNCTSSGSSFSFVLFDDGTGVSSALGSFTWTESACRSVDVVASGSTYLIRDLEGSIADGTGSFRQTNPNGSQLTATCTLE